jgi:hypothetical protein
MTRQDADEPVDTADCSFAPVLGPIGTDTAGQKYVPVQCALGRAIREETTSRRTREAKCSVQQYESFLSHSRQYGYHRSLSQLLSGGNGARLPTTLLAVVVLPGDTDGETIVTGDLFAVVTDEPCLLIIAIRLVQRYRAFAYVARLSHAAAFYRVANKGCLC